MVAEVVVCKTETKRNEKSLSFVSLSRLSRNKLPIKITLQALSLVARRLRLSSSSSATLHRIMLSGSRRENIAPASAPAEKKLATMATKSSMSSPTAEEFPPLRVKKLVPNALLPVRGSAGAAGYDLAR